MMKPHIHLCARERQIMDILYKRGQAAVGEIQRDLPSPPGYSAVRAMLRVLEEKGHVKHQASELRYVYTPTVGRERAKVSALRHLLATFFDGSAGEAVAALLDAEAGALSSEDLDRIAQRIERARKEGTPK